MIPNKGCEQITPRQFGEKAIDRAVTAAFPGSASESIVMRPVIENMTSMMTLNWRTADGVIRVSKQAKSDKIPIEMNELR